MGTIELSRAFHILFLLLLFFLTETISKNNSTSNTRCIEIERNALLRFKMELEDPSQRLSSWIPNVDCCKWVGISCDSLTGHVKEIKLANTRYVGWQTQAEKILFENSKLKGNLSDSILNLKHVSHLDLSFNDFGGIQIPRFLGSLVSLTYLNLTRSGFQGLIPYQLGNLSNLQQLGLQGDNPFFGPTLYSENLQWLQGLPLLRSLDLSYVDLSKASNWLSDINSKLSFLVELHLSRCQLNEISPLNHVNFTSLSVLDISFNNFHAFIPKWISKLDNLVSLDLSLGYFQGPLPKGFSNLTSLQNLNVESNYLNSSLPKWLFNLTSITFLNLGRNEFEGHPIPCAIQNLSALAYLNLAELFHSNATTIPTCLYSLHNLRYLDLHFLGLEGEISNDIVNLTNLVSLDFSSNKFRSIPTSIGSLCNLKAIRLTRNKIGQKLSDIFEIVSSGCLVHSLTSLDLSGNNVTGHLTNHIAKLKRLQLLYLGGNFISGRIPGFIGNLSLLKYLSLGGNELSGTLPTSIGLLSDLQELSISRNFLEGIVSEAHFTNLKSLEELYMSHNNLTLSFSNGWVPPFNLMIMQLRSCNLGPQFPEWLKSQKNFVDVDLSNTKISGIVPDWFWNLSSSYLYLNLSHNQLSGKIPDFLLDAQFTMIYLGSNKFHGNVPRISSNVTELDLSNNSFSGNMSHFLCHFISQKKRLEILHLGDNHLSGNIPDCWTKWVSLEVVKLGSNNFSGKLPSSMGSLINLMSLHLRNNSLFGNIPHSLKNCSKLRTLDLGLNAFQGNIPTWIGTNLPNLMVLGLRSNQLSGLIPYELCHLSSLQIMDMGNNNLIGSIPHCFGNFVAMAIKKSSLEHIFYSFYYGEFLENAYVVTKGSELQYNNILTLMTSMDLSDNKLSGEIPQEITNLFELRSLNLSGNNLNGSVPQQIGNMAIMESLDLSRNQLSGRIPQTMSKLTFLNYLNLSYNNLSGQIPIGAQLQGFDPSSFIGNELCGLPLPNNCSKEEKTPITENGEVKEGEKYFDEWFYLSLAIGFIVGFWGICCPLFMSKIWRHKYFRHLSFLWHKFDS